MNNIEFEKDNTDFFTINGDSSDISFSKPKSKSKPKMKLKAKQSKMPAFNDKTFEVFGNPEKQLPDEPDDEPDLAQEDEESMPDMDNAMSEGGMSEQMGDNDELEPSEGFKTIEDEKNDLLYKFYRLEQKGMKLPKKFNAFSDIREMRAEFQKIKKDSEMNSSLKFSKRVLLACVSGSEFLNKRYDPFGFELDGWSESIMTNMNDGDYDNVLERLCEKYSGRMNTPPELDLMLALVGSAMMFHMSNSMFKGVNGAMSADKVQEIVKKMQQQQSVKSPVNYPQQPVQREDPPTISVDGRREMRGPSVDLSQFGNVFADPGMIGMDAINENILPINQFPDPARVTIKPERAPSVMSDDSASELSASMKDISIISEGGTKRKGRSRKIKANASEIIKLDV